MTVSSTRNCFAAEHLQILQEIKSSTPENKQKEIWTDSISKLAIYVAFLQVNPTSLFFCKEAIKIIWLEWVLVLKKYSFTQKWAYNFIPLLFIYLFINNRVGNTNYPHLPWFSIFFSSNNLNNCFLNDFNNPLNHCGEIHSSELCFYLLRFLGICLMRSSLKVLQQHFSCGEIQTWLRSFYFSVILL